MSTPWDRLQQDPRYRALKMTPLAAYDSGHAAELRHWLVCRLGLCPRPEAGS